MHCGRQVRWSARQEVPTDGPARLPPVPGRQQHVCFRIPQGTYQDRSQSCQVPRQPTVGGSLLVRASKQQRQRDDDPQQVWRLQDLLTTSEEANTAAESLATNSPDGFPKQEWSSNQQAKQQYRQQQWELWKVRQQQLERHERVRVWREAQQQQQQQVEAGSEGSNRQGNMPYAYDQTRWKVRNQQWRDGPPPKLDYLVVSPRNAAEKHARYMAGRLLFRGSGRIMLLFHNYKGSTKTLAILATAARILQRKHSCTLLCQVGFTVHDPLKMRLLAKLWPYAGVLHPTPDAAALARSSSSSSSANGDEDEDQSDALDAGEGIYSKPPSVDSSSSSHVQDAGGSSSSSSSGRPQEAGGSSSSSSSWHRSQNAGGNSSSSSSNAGKGLMQQCLQGAVPPPHTLPATIRDLPAVAIPVTVSKHHTFTSSRTTDAQKLAKSLASSLAMKGRCRVQTAGGIAALNALTAVALAEYLLKKAQGRTLAMHVGAKKRVEQQVPGSREWPHVVMYYDLTLLVADADYAGVPATCVFKKTTGRNGTRNHHQQQHQQQQQQEKQR